MSKGLKVAAYEGGGLRMLDAGDGGNEVVLALPLSRLVAKVVKVPADADPVEFVTPVLKAACPYPDDDLAAGVEVMRESEDGKIVVAAALPESSADDIGEALDEAKLSVVKIDALVLGELRTLWSKIFVSGSDSQRRLLVMEGEDALSLVILDGDQICSLRCVDLKCPINREVMLGLLEAEDFAGEKELSEVLLCRREVSNASDESSGSAYGTLREELSRFAPLRELTCDDEAALKGIAERALEAGTLDVLPESWRDVLAETRFKTKLFRWLAFFIGVWVLSIGVLFGVPLYNDMRAAAEKEKCKRHSSQYREVTEMIAKVDLVKKYSDHSTGALAVMKAVSDRLPPDGITVERYTFKFDDSVLISAIADSSKHVYDFHDALEAITVEGEDEQTRLFKVVALKNLKSRSAKSTEQAFTIECRFHKEEEEE